MTIFIGKQEMALSDLRHPGWKFARVFETRLEVRAAATHAGPNYVVRCGSYDERNKPFLTGNPS
jgi:hypothetical protein